MNKNLKIKMYAFTIDCKDALKLAQFYAQLLHWEVVYHDDEYACVAPSNIKQGRYPGLFFQTNQDFLPPVWPEQPQQQQQMAHLDLIVNDLEAAVQYAIECGATLGQAQFSNEHRVMFDPSGHPFCLCENTPVVDSPEFALL